MQQHSEVKLRLEAWRQACAWFLIDCLPRLPLQQLPDCPLIFQTMPVLPKCLHPLAFLSCCLVVLGAEVGLWISQESEADRLDAPCSDLSANMLEYFLDMAVNSGSCWLSRESHSCSWHAWSLEQAGSEVAPPLLLHASRTCGCLPLLVTSSALLIPFLCLGLAFCARVTFLLRVSHHPVHESLSLTDLSYLCPGYDCHRCCGHCRTMSQGRLRQNGIDWQWVTFELDFWAQTSWQDHRAPCLQC